MRHTKLQISLVLAVCCCTAVAIADFPKRVPPDPRVSVGSSAEDVRRTQESADHLVEAILVSPGLAFKMPVLEAAFIDSPLWEKEVRTLIEREVWDVAKMHFIHFYWKRVTKKDSQFMANALSWVEESVRKDSSWTTFGIVDEMMSREQ